MSVLRLTGAWTGLLTDWLDRENLPAPEIRAALAWRAPDDIIPGPQWRALLEKAVALRPAAVAPELHIGAGVQPHHVGVLGYLVLATETLGEAMLAYQRYEKLFYGINIAQIMATGHEVEIRWQGATGFLGQMGDGVAIAALITFLRRQVENPPPPSLVTFTGTPQRPGDEQAYHDFFGCPVQFGNSHVRVRFPAEYLGIPMPHRDPALRALLDRQAQALLQALPDNDAFDRALQQLLPRLLAEGRATLPTAARALHVSPRTLQRRLTAHGISWQQFLDRARTQLAREYLADTSLSLSDVALLLGFSEQSAFNRAFRRWTGTTPGKLRR
ncbi:MAG: AraC family transcriptional regulator [Alcanivorax sp.]|nr:AraC family transcriptional regulator [Alcanivorax sp.]